MLWKTVYLEQATQALRDTGRLKDDSRLQYLAPLGWAHINLTGDYVWRLIRNIDEGKFERYEHLKNRSVLFFSVFLFSP